MIALDGQIRVDILSRVMLSLVDLRFVVGAVYRIERAVVNLIEGYYNGRQITLRN